MLTPNQLKSITFDQSRGTYRSVQVDALMEEIISSYEQMFNENGELINRLKKAEEILIKLKERENEYKQDEDALKNTLLSAQKISDKLVRDATVQSEKILFEATDKAERLTNSAQADADDVVTNASNNAKKILSDAESKANEVIEGAKLVADNVISQAKRVSEEIVTNAKREVEINQSVLDKIKAETANFKGELYNIYKAHVELINSIPTQAQEEYEQKQAAQAAAASEAANFEEQHDDGENVEMIANELQDEMDKEAVKKINDEIRAASIAAEEPQPQEQPEEADDKADDKADDEVQAEADDAGEEAEAFSIDQTVSFTRESASVEDIYSNLKIDSDDDSEAEGGEEQSGLSSANQVPPQTVELKFGAAPVQDDDDDDKSKFKGFFKKKK